MTFAAHGAQKLFGWFGGPGLDGTGQFFTMIGFSPGRRHALMAGLAETGGGLLLALGLILGGWVLGAQIKATRLSDRYATVKGLVERTVKSDIAIWPLSFKEAGDDLALVYGKTEASRKAVLQFLDTPRNLGINRQSRDTCKNYV